MDFQNSFTEFNNFLLTVQDLSMFVVTAMTNQLSVYGMVLPVWSISLLIVILGLITNAFLAIIQESRVTSHDVDNLHIEQRYRERLAQVKQLYLDDGLRKRL